MANIHNTNLPEYPILFFKSSLLNNISKHRSFISVKIQQPEVGFANAWNRRLSSVFSALGSPYVACMKRSFFLSLMIDAAVEAELLLGIVPNDAKLGHAWISTKSGIVLAEHFDKEETNYQVIKKYPIG